MLKQILICIILVTSPCLYASTASIIEIKNLYQTQQYNACLTQTNIYLSEHPQDQDAWLYRAYAYYQLKNYTAAVHAFNKTIELDKHEAEAWKGLVSAYSQLGNFEEAQVTLLKAKPFLSPEDNTWYVSKLKSLTQAIAVPKQPDAVLISQNTAVKTQNKANIASSKSTAPDLNILKQLYKNNKLEQAEHYAKLYIKSYPKDPDGYFFLGLIYQKQENWAQAYKQFAKVLQLSSLYPDARQSAINDLFAMNQLQQVINLAKEGLLLEPAKVDYQYDIANALSQLHQYQAALATLTAIANYAAYPSVKNLYDEINAETAYRYISYYQVGANTSSIFVKNPNQYWSLSTVYLQYNTPQGNIGTNINYQTRPNLDAPQYEVYAQPRFSKNNYANLAYAYANNPNLFPEQLIQAEDYQFLPWDFEISIGDTYRKLPNFYINAYTASLGKYLGSYFLQFRPTYFATSSGPDSMLYTGTLQKYFSAENYVGISISAGTAPDLANLDTPTALKTDYSSLMFNGQTLVTKRWITQYGIGEIRQDFGNQNIRHYTYINLGLSYRDV